MTIELQTGLPGNGKTLYTLDRIEGIRRRTGRSVYYSGIPINSEKLPDWQELPDPKKWFDVPPESIVVIDEAQRIFRPRPAGSAVPEHESRLETHRHGGIDLVLLTQNPKLIASNVRELCGKHFHIVRNFGLQRATVHEWQECKVNTQARKDSIKHLYSYRKEVYTWYKSAEAHTVKSSIPAKVWVLGFLILALPLLGFFIWNHLHRMSGGASVSPVEFSQSVEPSRGALPVRDRAPMTGAEYARQFVARVPGLHYTAPAYDEVTKPVRAPYPAACIQSRTRCQCYTQQGTRLEVTPELCKGIAEGGFFMAWDERSQHSVPVAVPRPDLRLDGDVSEAVGINAGYQPQRVPFQSSQAPQVDQDAARPRANRSRGG